MGNHLQELCNSNVKHHGAISKHFKNVDAFRAEKQSHHEVLVNRLETIEQSHGERHDQHTSAAEDLHAKCQSISDQLAGMEKHGQQMSDLQQSHESLGAKKAELQAGHALLGDRVEFLEKRFGEIQSSLAVAGC